MSTPFSHFREIDNKEYHAIIKDKEEARREYESAKRKGLSAGHVATK